MARSQQNPRSYSDFHCPPERLPDSAALTRQPTTQSAQRAVGWSVPNIHRAQKTPQHSRPPLNFPAALILTFIEIHHHLSINALWYSKRMKNSLHRVELLIQPKVNMRVHLSL
jgi:hypothetical protein